MTHSVFSLGVLFLGVLTLSWSKSPLQFLALPLWVDFSALGHISIFDSATNVVAFFILFLVLILDISLTQNKPKEYI